MGTTSSPAAAALASSATVAALAAAALPSNLRPVLLHRGKVDDRVDPVLDIGGADRHEHLIRRGNRTRHVANLKNLDASVTVESDCLGHQPVTGTWRSFAPTRVICRHQMLVIVRPAASDQSRVRARNSLLWP